MTNHTDGDNPPLECIDELENVGDRNEMGCHSAVESGYKEPRTFKMMMKTPEDERKLWIDGVNE